MMSFLANDTIGVKRKVAVYIRVSTSEQDVEGFSIEAQKKRLVGHVQENKSLNLTTRPEWLFVDVSTGGDLNRNGYKKMMELVKKKEIDAVLVWRIDRLSRNLKHLITSFEAMQKSDVSFISLQENIDFKGPIGKLIFQIFGAIAEFERELISGRSYMGRYASAEMGNFTRSHIPYGYDEIKNGKRRQIKTIPEEKEWVQKIFHWYIYEGLGDKAISTRLNELKVPLGKHSKAKKNRVWKEEKINAILKEPLYAGEYIAINKDENRNPLPSDKWVIVEVPNCITEFLFRQAQEVRNTKTGKNHSDYMLTGRMWDMAFNPPRSFSGAARTKGGFSYRRKKFEKKGVEYSNFEIPGKQLDEFVWGKVKEALKKPEVFIKNFFAKNHVNKTQIEEYEEELPRLREENLNFEMDLSRADDKLVQGKISDNSHERITSQTSKKLTENAEKIFRITSELKRLANIEVETKKLRDISSQINFRLDNLSLRQKKIICMLFISKIEVHTDKKTVNKNGKIVETKEIYFTVRFKFNPEKFENYRIGVEPEMVHKNSSTKELKRKIDGTGATSEI